jgi:hypothetical protein
MPASGSRCRTLSAVGRRCVMWGLARPATARGWLASRRPFSMGCLRSTSPTNSGPSRLCTGPMTSISRCGMLRIS